MLSKAESMLRVEAMRILIKYLGEVNAERFVNSIKNDSFDYTKWQSNLWQGQSVEEIHNKAAAFYAESHKTS